MTPAGIVTIVEIGLGVALLWILYFWLWRDYRTAKLRYDLFLIRDGLFDAWQEMELDYSHPAYVAVRESINGLIRYAHRMTFWGMIVPVLISLRTAARTGAKTFFLLKKEADSLGSEEARTAVLGTYYGATYRVIGHIIAGAPLLIPILAAFFIYAGAKRFVRLGLLGFWDWIARPAYVLAEALISKLPAVNVIPLEGRTWFRADVT